MRYSQTIFLCYSLLKDRSSSLKLFRKKVLLKIWKLFFQTKISTVLEVSVVEWSNCINVNVSVYRIKHLLSNGTTTFPVNTVISRKAWSVISQWGRNVPSFWESCEAILMFCDLIVSLTVWAIHSVIRVSLTESSHEIPCLLGYDCSYPINWWVI